MDNERDHEDSVSVWTIVAWLVFAVVALTALGLLQAYFTTGPAK